jgi:hypothetical protein
MRVASYALIGLAVVFVVLGLVNHYELVLNPIPHLSTIIGGLAAICFIAGVALLFLGGRASTAR